MATQNKPRSGLTIVEEPTTETQEAIVDEILNDPEATNGEVADAVQDRLGGDEDDRPSASWVSRIRSTKLAERDVADVPDDVGWGDVDYRRMRQVAAVRNIDVGQNPTTDELVDALEADGVPPEAVAAIPDDDVHDPDAIEAVVRNVQADSAYDADRHDVAEDGAGTEARDERNGLDGRTTGLESTVEELREEVAEANERLRKVEALVVGEYTDELVADVLRRRADDLDGRS